MRFSQFTLVLLLILSPFFSKSEGWEDIIKNKSGKVVFYWYPNNITIKESKDIIDGVEHDLAISFINYLSEKYQVQIELDWVKTNSFQEVLDQVGNGDGGIFGASSISITKERSKRFEFTPPYLADIAVLVSNSSVPVAYTEREFIETFSQITAVSIHNTTLSDAILNLNDSLNLDLELEYVSNSGEIIDRIASSPKSFGYIDLPNFLVSFENKVSVRRQYYYPIKLQGLSMIYPKGSDWIEPVEDYFNSNQFHEDRDRIVNKYLGADVTQIIERIAKSVEIGPLEEIAISNREKELQYEELLESAKKEKDQSIVNLVLIGIICLVLIVAVYLYTRFYIKSRANQILVGHQRTIELRNEQLQLLNDEKNDLIKVLAHDLRAPLANIAGFSKLMKANERLNEEDKKLVGFVEQSSEKMTSMISKILDIDAIESGKHNIDFQQLDLKSEVNHVVIGCQKTAGRKNILITCSVDDEIQIRADRFYLHQILENLLSNAIKFSDEGTEVKISSVIKKDLARIAITDQGPGFEKEEEHKVFKKYQRMSARPTGAEDSIGLGLSIVRLYTELMGGKASFETEVGVGTTFFIDLKRASTKG